MRQDRPRITSPGPEARDWEAGDSSFFPTNQVLELGQLDPDTVFRVPMLASPEPVNRPLSTVAPCRYLGVRVPAATQVEYCLFPHSDLIIALDAPVVNV